MINQPLRKGHVVAAGETYVNWTRHARGEFGRYHCPPERGRGPRSRNPSPSGRGKARLEEAKINFNAADKLAQGGFASETRVASTQAAVRSAEAAVESAKAGFDATSSRINPPKPPLPPHKKRLIA